MRAAVMRNSKIVVDDVAEPVPGDGEVLVRTLACGICGSDLHALEYTAEFVRAGREMGASAPLDASRDVIMGHEFAAEILDYGPGTSRSSPIGTTVCSLPIVLRAGGIETIGYSNMLPGGYGERMVLSEGFLLPVPNGLDACHAALTEPMAVGLHAVEKARLEPNDVPLVIGCGPVGLAVVASLKMKGASPIVAADFSATRRALAQRLGADVVIDPGAESPYQRWRELAVVDDPSRAVDPLAAMLGMPLLRRAVIFECVGVRGMLKQIMKAAPKLARVVVVGVCMQSDEIEPLHGIGRELELQFVLAYTPVEFGMTLYNIAEGKLDVGPLITGKIPIDGVPNAFSELKSPDRHAKIVVVPA